MFGEIVKILWFKKCSGTQYVATVEFCGGSKSFLGFSHSFIFLTIGMQIFCTKVYFPNLILVISLPLLYFPHHLNTIFGFCIILTFESIISCYPRLRREPMRGLTVWSKQTNCQYFIGFQGWRTQYNNDLLSYREYYLGNVFLSNRC